MLENDRDNGLAREDEASLTERAYQAISRAIANLEFKPGEVLRQDRLARWLSISRTPVREALRRLEQEGIIQTVAGRGLIVAELTVKDVEDMLDLLRLTDAHAAFLAAQRRSDQQAARLLEVTRELLAAAEAHDIERWTQADRPYHDIVLSAAGNQLLRQTIQDVRRRLHRITINSGTRPERLIACTHEHVAVAEAIAARDAEAARRLMAEHIDAMSRSAMALIHTYIVPVRGERF
ncbi:GntR family transcriptional regulator [Kallotenue papyrolyticum]|uniref:GntR family transcriptional regulator n=1 Tax=Kallotenue papyrolyticum TaxID=1325125 RepID=UPI0004715443|nr:GntR family transcriptional regulator [Kallotenue papyrolyticum]